MHALASLRIELSAFIRPILAFIFSPNSALGFLRFPIPHCFTNLAVLYHPSALLFLSAFCFHVFDTLIAIVD